MSGEAKRKIRLSGGLGLAALMFSTYIGPGYASGTQTVSFYLTKGWIGVFLAPIVLGILSFVWSFIVFEFNRVYRPKNYREQSDMIYKNPVLKYCLGVFKEIIAFFQVFVVVSAMISGAATLLNSMAGVPMVIGTVIFALALVALTLKGTKLVTKVSGVLTIIILAIVIYIAVIGIGPTWDGMKGFLAEHSQPEDFGFTKVYAWFVILGSIFNFLAGANAAVPACLETIHSRADVIIAATGNAVFCTGATIICTMMFAAGMPEIAGEPLPMIYTLQKLVGAGAWVQYLYFVIALAAMLSTGVSLVYGMVERWTPVVGKAMANGSETAVRFVIAFALVVACVLMSRIGILVLVNKVYPILFNIGTPVIFYLLFITIPYRVYKDKKDGVYPAEQAGSLCEKD
ncbi:hypothetical protein MUJ63_04845 [Lachnospiraceae bacterium NSJ-143]|nr:hypothetical protein [Lachnospiraceae bacterium NSJ-143]